MRIPLSLLFLLLVLGEITGFILVGETIGVLATLGLTLFGMVAGVLLLRWRGVATLMRARAEMDAGRAPARSLAHGAILAFAALLIVLPGFLTDAVGVLLFVPPLRTALWQAFGRRLKARTVMSRASTAQSPSAQESAVVDLDRSEYGARPDSPWRQDRGPEA